MSELLDQLESNSKEKFEEAKKKILDQFGQVRDSWLVNGLYNYYLETNSSKVIVILVNVREPHHQFLFDRLSDSIGKNAKNDHKVQALTLLGHIVRSEPTWLYKLPEHHLLKDLLRLLKYEGEILPLISALLVLITLIPMIPHAMAAFLNDIFDIFSRLAAWNYTPGCVIDELVHMQVVLHAFFLRLYGMFPCNFLAYLRTLYKDKNRPVFIHTIKPILESVKMNPSLVTTSKDTETTNERWKKMAVHDIIVECERFSVDISDNSQFCCPHDESCCGGGGFRSRSGTNTVPNKSTIDTSYYQTVKNLVAAAASTTTTTTSDSTLNPILSSTAPAALVTTHQREFTHDASVVPPAGSSPPEAAIEATPDITNTSGGTVKYTGGGPVSPKTPSKKEQFTFPTPQKTPGAASSPLKIHQVANSDLGDVLKTNDIDTDDLSGVDLKRRRESITFRQVDSVFHESEESTSDNNAEEDRSSPCSMGGLHMPNSKSMKEFAQRVQRLRHHSQCTTVSSPECDEDDDYVKTYHHRQLDGAPNGIVRRANSCPEMKKSPVSSFKDNCLNNDTSATTLNEELDEDDDDGENETELHPSRSSLSNGGGPIMLISSETQTYNFWPMPYEHLFLGIFPTLGVSSADSSAQVQNTSTASSVNQTLVSSGSCHQTVSIYDILDRYIETTVGKSSEPNNSVKILKNQLQLLHQQLLFERHRREIHAFKNRRFLAESKNTQVLEEHNSALRDQVQLQQADNDNLKRQLTDLHAEKNADLIAANRTIAELQNDMKSLQDSNRILIETVADVRNELHEYKTKFDTLEVVKEQCDTALSDALVEAKLAKEQALAGEKGRTELEYVNKQMVLIGDLNLKYRERLEELSALRRTDKELEMLTEAYNGEIQSLQKYVQEKTAKMDQYQNRIEILEQTVDDKDKLLIQQKQLTTVLNEQYQSKLSAIQTKYEAQMSVCTAYEQKILDLYRQIEMAQLQNTRSGTIGKQQHSHPHIQHQYQSPDVSSCQEVYPASSFGGRTASGSSSVVLPSGGGASSSLSCSLASSSNDSGTTTTPFFMETCTKPPPASAPDTVPPPSTSQYVQNNEDLM